MRSAQVLSLSLLLLALLACPTQAAAPKNAAAQGGLPEKIFGPVKAGRWYPEDKARLEKQIQAYLSAAPAVKDAEHVRAIIAPHAGYTWSGPTAAYAYKPLVGRSFRRVLLLGPSHSQGFAGFSVLNASQYRTPLGLVPVDTEVLASLRSSPLHHASPAAWRDEHSLEMQIPFLQTVLRPGFAIVPILVGAGSGEAEIKALAQRLRPLLDAQTLLVVSSDFTHFGPNYGYVPFTQEVPQRLRRDRADPAYQAIASGDPARFAGYLQSTHDTICGRTPILVFLHMQLGLQAERLHVDSSGAISGDFANSVTYQAIVLRSPQQSEVGGETQKPAFHPAPSELSAPEKKSLLAIARASLSQHLRHDGSLDRLRSALADSPGLELPRGAFVTINRRPTSAGAHPTLRGCIGYMDARGPLRQVVASLAVEAGTRDPRFAPMRAAELDDVFFEISVLSPMRPVASWRDIIIGTHGMTLQKNGHRAVFLPQVAPEWGWSLDETLTHLAKKAGLGPDDWRQGARFEVFTADVFSEERPHR